MFLLWRYYKVFYSIIITIELFLFGCLLGLVIDRFILYRLSQNFSLLEFYTMLDLLAKYYHFSILPIFVLVISILSIIVYVYNSVFISSELLSRLRLEATVFIKGFMPFLIIISIIPSGAAILENIYRLHIDLIFMDVVSQVGYSYFILLGINNFFFNLAAYLLLSYASYVLVFLIKYRILYNIIRKEGK